MGTSRRLTHWQPDPGRSGPAGCPECRRLPRALATRSGRVGTGSSQWHFAALSLGLPPAADGTDSPAAPGARKSAAGCPGRSPHGPVASERAAPNGTRRSHEAAQERPTERTRTRRQASRGGRRDVNEVREACRGPAFAGRPTRITYSNASAKSGLAARESWASPRGALRRLPACCQGKAKSSQRPARGAQSAGT